MVQQPTQYQRESLALMIALAMPHDAEGRILDQPPGLELPEGATEAMAPDLYPAAEWVSHALGRLWPDEYR